MEQDVFTLLKQGFEQWYNSGRQDRVSVVINYSDEQTLLIKAYHKVKAVLSVIGIKNNMSYSMPLIEVSEHYNHGGMNEEEAKQMMAGKMMVEMMRYAGRR